MGDVDAAGRMTFRGASEFITDVVRSEHEPVHRSSNHTVK
jgi:hypothetical protein